jgi:beta-lactamase class A
MNIIDIWRIRRCSLVYLLVLLVHLVYGQEKIYTKNDFETRFKEIETEAACTLGVAIMHLGTGEKITYRGEERFPMASVFKIPVALQFLHLVDHKKINLEDSITITRSDFRPGTSFLASQELPSGSMTMTNEELFKLMLVHSDNTACDILLTMSGGPKAVTRRMQELDTDDIRVDRCIAELMCDYVGVMEEYEDKGWSFQLINDLFSTVTEESRKEAFKKFLEDQRDTATPDDMVELLAQIAQYKALKLSTTNLLLETLEEVLTGEERIKGKLPADTEVAHKTGTSGTFNGVNAATNDVGIIRLPGRAGEVAIAVFIKASEKDLQTREEAIAEIARMAYDYWLEEDNQ